ncbi:MYG1 family protein [Luteolibacter ambystomatis]|uniref:MYG1 family protein n=1 Tax=Luteolibacter ambystomatis TaxID=2824561 RepID=A0A975G6P1_9BACT|nr:MYG1 family protein [Luteolibacter ambystomatis]QUE49953.1 MYG1 family protein [Luteolibacter ambystomatis]
MSISLILTHPGGAHKDELLACSLLAAVHGVPIERREPTQADLDDVAIAVVDVGGEHDPARNNFDHHQFPADHPPACALTLVLQHLGVYEDARKFCDWLEPAEWFDTRGPVSTAKWLGVDRDTLAKLNSPVDVTVLRRFAKARRLEPGNPIWELLRFIGEDLLDYLRNLRERLDFIAQHAELWDVGGTEVLFLPRTESMSEEPSAGLGRYLESIGKSASVAGLVYPDRRGSGYGLSRHNDSPLFDFTRIQEEHDVHFAHARGFVAKTSAAEQARLRELLAAARV